MSIDDEAIDRLVEAAQSGDPDAFGALFDRYYVPVYRFVAARIGRPSDAEDLAQLVFVKALEALPRYESRGIPFGGWLFRLARNVVIDHIRTRREHATLDIVTERSSDEASPDDLAVLRQEMDSVAHALRRLTPEQREAIELRFFAGLSAKEAAEAMGRQEGTVRGLQFRAIAALRRDLGIAADDLPEASGTTR
ncbi:MAG TPA: sigma-70 family RNA polymerase sigma factor [Candidatus Limnocylindrales bacterium]